MIILYLRKSSLFFYWYQKIKKKKKKLWFQDRSCLPTHSARIRTVQAAAGNKCSEMFVTLWFLWGKKEKPLEPRDLITYFRNTSAEYFETEY